MNDSLKVKIKELVDDVAGAGTSDNIEGKAREALGKVQETIGETLGDPELQEAGQKKQERATTQQAIADIKEQFRTEPSLAETVKMQGEELADTAKSRAKNVVDDMKDYTKELTKTVKDIL